MKLALSCETSTGHFPSEILRVPLQFLQQISAFLHPVNRTIGCESVDLMRVCYMLHSIGDANLTGTSDNTHGKGRRVFEIQVRTGSLS